SLSHEPSAAPGRAKRADDDGSVASDHDVPKEARRLSRTFQSSRRDPFYEDVARDASGMGALDRDLLSRHPYLDGALRNGRLPAKRRFRRVISICRHRDYSARRHRTGSFYHWRLQSPNGDTGTGLYRRAHSGVALCAWG